MIAIIKDGARWRMVAAAAKAPNNNNGNNSGCYLSVKLEEVIEFYVVYEPTYAGALSSKLAHYVILQTSGTTFDLTPEMDEIKGVGICTIFLFISKHLNRSQFYFSSSYYFAVLGINAEEKIGYDLIWL